MTEVTNSICDSDVSVSGYSGIHVPHQSCRGMHLPKNLIWSMEHMYQFHPEHSLERGFGVFSRIDVRLWLRCWESFSCRKAHQCPQFRCQPRAVWWLQGWQKGGTVVALRCPQCGLLCVSAHRAGPCSSSVAARGRLQPGTGVLVLRGSAAERLLCAATWADHLQMVSRGICNFYLNSLSIASSRDCCIQ